MMAHGYVAKQPELQQFNANTVKVEFDLLDKRYIRVNSEWKQVIESAKFVAWGDDARRLSEQLIPGRTLSVTGQQETSRWTDDQGTERHKTVYKVLSFQFDPAPERQQQRQAENAHGEGNSRGYQPQGGSGRGATGQQAGPGQDRDNRFQPRASAQAPAPTSSDRHPVEERRLRPLPVRSNNPEFADSNGFVSY
jgi:single-stranded DNA-binding protein